MEIESVQPDDPAHVATKVFYEVPDVRSSTLPLNLSVKLSKLLVYYQNVRGLNSKTKEFYLSSSASDYDVICLTETWLNTSVFDAELFNPNYTVYRVDRSPANSSKSKAGGVLIAVKSHIPSKIVSVVGAESVEIVFVKSQLIKN